MAYRIVKQLEISYGLEDCVLVTHINLILFLILTQKCKAMLLLPHQA